MKLRVPKRNSSQRRFGFERFDDFPSLERFARTSQNERQSQVFWQQLLFSHQKRLARPLESSIRHKRIRNFFVACDPRDRLAFHNMDVDLRRQFSHHLHLVDLRELLYPVMNAAQVHAENVSPSRRSATFKTCSRCNVPSVCSSIVFN